MIKKAVRVTKYFVCFGLLFIILSNIWIVYATKGKLYSDVENIPESEIGLVLGTSKKLRKGVPNPFFTHRIDAAVELYHKGKIKQILVSGDNRTIYYNEPKDMQKELVARGVPKKDIILDYAGLRTLDSIVRCKKIFKKDKITIITQGFHNHRALFISNFYQMDAVGFDAQNASKTEAFKTELREYLARAKAVVDLYIIKKDPKFNT